MVRVMPMGTGVGAGPTASAPGPAAARHRDQLKAASGVKPAYKVVMEETLQPKKKLLISGYSQQEPPPGYTFIAAGDPQLTKECKELSRKEGARIYVVSTTRHQDTELSLQVHRIGWHFQSSIVERVCTSLGITLTPQGQVLRQQDHPVTEKPKKTQGRKGLSRIDKKALKNLRQEEVDREAREAIKDLFPAIPQEDLDTIVSRAFALGSKKVGAMVDDLSLPRRVQLAVVAHIRHIYTDYDNLLQHLPWMQARSQVEALTLERLARWRGDDNENDDPDAMEEILREVIVISDDDDDVAVGQAASSNNAVSSQFRTLQDSATRHEIVYIRSSPVDYGHGSVTQRPSASPEMAEMHGARHLGGGQFIVAPRSNNWMIKARNRQDHVWKEAQRRVQDPNYQQAHRISHLPQSTRPAQPVRVNTVYTQQPTYESDQRSATYVGSGARLVSDGGGAVEVTTRPPASNVPSVRYIDHPALEEPPSKNLRIDRDRKALNLPLETPKRTVHVVEPLSPSDIVLPSIEPITPTRTRQFVDDSGHNRHPQIVYLSPRESKREYVDDGRRLDGPASEFREPVLKRRRYPDEVEGRIVGPSGPRRHPVNGPSTNVQAWQSRIVPERSSIIPLPPGPHARVLGLDGESSPWRPSIEPQRYNVQTVPETSHSVMYLGHDRRGATSFVSSDPNRRIPELRPVEGHRPMGSAMPTNAYGHVPPNGPWISSSLVRGQDGRLYERRVTHQPGPHV